MIPEFRARFNRRFDPKKYASLVALLEQRCGARIEFRVAETPIFVPPHLLKEMAATGAGLAKALMGNKICLEAARNAIPPGYCVARETAHPNFLTADFSLVRGRAGELIPKLVELQAFPSVHGYQAELGSAYRDVFGLEDTLNVFLSELNEEEYWKLLTRTIIANHDPKHVVLLEIDPLHQKTRPDFEVTARRLGIAVVDIRGIEAIENKLHYRDGAGRIVPIHRIYNRAIPMS